MSEPFVAEIRIFAGNFAPRNWAFCNGQLLPISQNTALFSLIGTTYGGDGRTTTALPNLQGRAPMHPGRGPGLTSRRLGESGGTETITLAEAQMPAHNHLAVGSSGQSKDQKPNGTSWGTTVNKDAYRETDDYTNLDNQVIQQSGANSAHNNLQPFLVVNYIIALAGVYPSRS
jgi:microcystin-dependent protein